VLKVCKFQFPPIHPPLGDFQDARETVDDFLQVRAALICVTPYFLVWIFMWWVTWEVSSMVKASELSRWSMIDLEMMGVPPRPYIFDRGALHVCMITMHT
jgi:hypothetical protein